MALLHVNNLKVWYPVRGGWFRPARYLHAVDGVSFHIKAGETLGLVGESGCGKSTLGRALVGLESLRNGGFTIDGINLNSLHGKELRRSRKKIQMIFQDPYGSLNPRLTVFSAINEVLTLHTQLNKSQRIDRVAELLDLVGLGAEYIHRYPHQFSGGQRQRVGIARALAAEPKVIVADEPVSALDVSVQAQIINLMRSIQDTTGTAFLFIAHDLAVVEHISHRIIVMYLGNIVESGPSSKLCAAPQHPYTRALLSAVPTLDAETGRKRIILSGDVPSPLAPPPGCRFHPRCPLVQDICRRETPELKAAADDSEHCSACFFPERVAAMTNGT